MMNNSQGASSFFSGLSTLLGRPHPLLHNLSDTTYVNGAGVTQDFPRAVALYQQACDGGLVEACQEGVPQDLAPAASLYLQACDGGEMQGCFDLAESYRTGDGAPQNLARAVILYQRACAGGFKVVGYC